MIAYWNTTTEEWNPPAVRGLPEMTAPPAPARCLYCTEPIDGPTRGFMTEHEEFVHAECLLRCVLGGVGHILDHDFWCTHMEDPDAGMSYRASAVEVEWLVRNRPSQVLAT